MGPEQGGRIPAIALTAYSRTKDRVQALAAGFQMHMPKPVNAAELAIAIASIIGRFGH
jgi:CheY-like chemotaxis protein